MKIMEKEKDRKRKKNLRTFALGTPLIPSAAIN